MYLRHSKWFYDIANAFTTSQTHLKRRKSKCDVGKNTLKTCVAADLDRDVGRDGDLDLEKDK